LEALGAIRTGFLGHSLRKSGLGSETTKIQAPSTLEALDNVCIRYASGCNVPYIEAPMGVSVLLFGGVSASEEMLNLLGFPSANCPTDNTQLYLNVFQKCSEFCGGNLRRERTTTFRVVFRTEDAKLYSDVYQKYRQGCKDVSREGPNTISNGTSSAADVMRVDCESRKLKSTNAADVFQSYYALCSRGISGRRSVNVRQTTTVSSSNFIHDNGLRNTGPSTSHGGRNACGNPKVGITTGEATCLRGIGGRPSLNVRQPTTVSSSNFIHDNNLRNTGPSTSRVGRNIRENPEVGLITGEATCSRGIHGHPSDNVRHTITVCSSNFIHDNDARNTGPSTLRGGINTHVNPEVILTTTEAICSSSISRRRLVRRRTLTHGPTVGSSSVAGAGSLCPPPGEAPRFLHLYIYDTDNEVENRMRHFGGIHNSDLDPEMVDGLIYFLDAYNELVQLFRTTRDKCGELDIPEFKIRLYNGQGVRGYEFPTSNTLGALAFESERMSFAEFLSRRFNLLFFLKEERIFGNVTGVLYTVEFQKRRLPHFALVELPDLRVDLDGYNIVSETMMHGPCGAAYFNASCMKGDKPMGKSSTEAAPSREMVDEIQNYVEGRFIYMQRITFKDRDRLRSVVDLPGKKNTTLTEWFAYNASNETGRHLSYLKFPLEFVWHSDSKSWPPQRNNKSSIGPLGLLGDDREWETALEVACVSMSQDIPKKVSEKVQIPNYHLNSDSLQGYTLYELEVILNNYGKSLQSFGLPPPPADLLEQLANRLLMEERNCNREELIQLKNDSVPRLNADQKAIYDLIINADENSRQKLIFVYDHGGIGKTFLWKTIISSLHLQGNIVLAVASSGITSLFLPSGRTAHSRFKLPLELSEESLCRITKNTQLGKLLADTNLIIWDEAPMNDHHYFEALDRSLRDIVNIPSSLFGGKSVLLGGDFRQTLRVKKGASKMEIIASCIFESALWPSFEVFTLKQNMRLERLDITLEEHSLVNSFASWLLDIGDEKTGRPAEEDLENTS
ncbi:DNA helicase, partial [Tanacetum coccineum]